MSNPADMADLTPHRTGPHSQRLSPAVFAWFVAAAALCAPGAARAQLIPGIDEWAEATVKSGESKWKGPRVPFPTPMARPESQARLRSLAWPLTLHGTERMSAARAERTLRSLEDAYALFVATGFVDSFGDGGQAGTGDHDVYIVPFAPAGVDAQVDATEPFSPLDGARAFALLDARIPGENLEVCAAQALAEMLFYERDPAEAESVRKSSAAYLAFLATGRMGCDDAAERADDAPYRAPFGPETGAGGARFLSLIETRETRGTGVFLRDMWQFARQDTWEGAGLRASPDLLEAMVRSIELHQERFEDIAAELALTGYLARTPDLHKTRKKPISPLMAEVLWDELPEHVGPAEPALEPLGSAFALVHTGGRAAPLKVWFRGELGVRWALGAVKLDAQGRDLGRLRVPARDNPNGFLVIELDPSCQSVLLAVTNMSDGTPDADAFRGDDVRSVLLMLDR